MRKFETRQSFFVAYNVLLMIRRTCASVIALVWLFCVSCESKGIESPANLNGTTQASTSAKASSAEVATIRRDVEWLSDDAREGRLPGTRGAEESADYIEARFKSLQLQPAFAGFYRQPFTMTGVTRIAPATFLKASGQPLDIDKQFRPLSFSAVGTFEGDVVFAGYGVTSEKYKYDDYANVNVQGKVVLAMRFEPHDARGRSRFTGGEFSEAATIPRKAQAALAKGAIALLLVNPPANHPEEAPLRPFVAEGARFAEAGIPVVSVAPEVADKLLGGLALSALQKSIDEEGTPRSFVINTARVTGKVDLETTAFPTANVAAILPGKGPAAQEYVVVGAHYDHIGRGKFSSRKPESGLIHNGADDNASGVSAMLAVAEQLAAEGPLQRSVLFVAFSGEETGLIGSVFFVNHPPVTIDKMVAMLNLDMVGRVRQENLFIGGGGTRAAFKQILADADATSPLQFKSIGEGGMGPSDHQAFALKKVPVLFLFSGIHAQYHHPDDDANLINYDGLAEVSDVTRAIIERLAASPREQYVDVFDSQMMLTEFDPSATTKPTTQQTHIARASLGVIPDYGTDLGKDGVRIGGAVPNSPAAKAGLTEGDVLVGWNDSKINNLYDLTDLLAKAVPGDEVNIHFRRGETTRIIRVTLSARRANN